MAATAALPTSVAGSSPAATPSAGSFTATTLAPASSQAAESYTVQQGDTLFGVSRRTGIPVPEIARLNAIPADSGLRTGQQLRLPSGVWSSGLGIHVMSPDPGATVRSPLVVQGTASAFEGVVNVEVLDTNGTQLARASATASQPDAGQHGPFRVEVAVPGAGAERRVTLRVFWRSPRDGSPTDEVRIPLTLVG